MMTKTLLPALLSVAVFAVPAQASVMTYTQGSFNAYSLRDEYPQSGDRHASSVGAIGTNASFSAWAQADYGTLKVYASGAASSAEHAAAFASASMGDMLTLSNTNLNGQKGLLTVGFYSESMLSASNYTPYGAFGTRANYNLDVTMATSYLGIKNSRLLVNQGLHVDDDPSYTTSSGYVWAEDVNGTRHTGVSGKFFTLTQEFVWGVPINLHVNMWVDGHHAAYPYGPNPEVYGRFTADGSHSTYWAGIQSITTGGATVSEFLLSSASGTDYSQSFVPASDVPEPASLALFGIALTGLQAVRRRVRKPA